MVRRVKRRGKTRRELLAREDEFRRLREERAKLVEVNGAEPPRVPALPPPARPGAPHAGEPRPEPDGRALTGDPWSARPQEARARRRRASGEDAATGGASSSPPCPGACPTSTGSAGRTSSTTRRAAPEPVGVPVRASDWIHDERHCEAQWYTDKLDNACVRDGRLRIIARLERSHGCRYTSARLRTKHRGDWLYGRVEVRARLPPSRRGLWPAIWMLPTDDAFGGWPHSGEIDIMEHVGWEQDGLIHAAAHSTKHNPCVGHQRSQSKLVPTAHRGFHTYAMNWTPKALEIFVDNGLALRVEDKGRGPGDWPYSKRFHLLLNLAIGGWGGQYGIDDTAFPACLEVDSVRVFQRSWRESEPEQ
ncbi:glycosyl hydrolase [Aureococcus anophagefferens]|nr:glycosyl hydrolase [Aureococcus anophagefferens]